MSAENGACIHVQLLGGFGLTVNGRTVEDTTSRSYQVWNLLSFFIANRQKALSQDEIITAIWLDDEIDNPSSALKNLVYRIRTMLTGHDFPYAKDLVIFQQGAYHYNNLLNTQVDSERFEQLCQEALKGADEEEPQVKLPLLLEAIDLYKGDFLPGSAYEGWVVPVKAYYHSLYMKCVYAVLEALHKLKNYEEIERICEQALKIEQLDEKVHKFLIYSQVKQGKQAQALAHYNHVTDLFYRELGVSPSRSLRNLYREITKSVNNVETDLSVIREDLDEAGEVSGAYYCEYEVFKNMYRVEARTAVRTGQAVFIALVTVTDVENKVPSATVLNETMSTLLRVVCRCLRKGDVVSRFSATQYVLMLPILTLENGYMVLERIAKSFHQRYGKMGLKLHTTLQSLKPVPEQG